MQKSLIKKKEFDLVSIKTKDLKKNLMLSICKLKNSYWSWTIPKQLEWLKKNAKKEDINNIMVINNRLIGYTLLRKRIAYVNNKPLKYFYFDSFLIDKRFRNKGYGRVLLLFNNKILKRLKKHSFLVCPKKTISFYSKYNWKILTKNSFKIMDHKPTWIKNKKNLYGMVYNLDKKIKKKMLYFLN